MSALPLSFDLAPRPLIPNLAYPTIPGRGATRCVPRLVLRARDLVASDFLPRADAPTRESGPPRVSAERRMVEARMQQRKIARLP